MSNWKTAEFATTMHQGKVLQISLSKTQNFGDVSEAFDDKTIEQRLEAQESKTNAQDFSTQECFEFALNWAKKEFAEEEFVKANHEFQTLFGKVNHEDHFYHQRMNYFRDYFLFDRITVLNDSTHGSVFSMYLQSEDFLTRTLSYHFKQFVEQMINCKHSIFLIYQLTSKNLTLKCAISDKTYIIDSRNLLLKTFEQGAYLQGVIYPVLDRWLISDGMLVHPKEASTYIKKELKQLKNMPSDSFNQYLFLYARRQLALTRHKSLSVKDAYNMDPKFT